MSSPITDIAAAEAALKRKVAWQAEPALTDGEGGELRGVLGDNEVGSVWAAGESYELGDLVLPTDEARVGLMFECVSPGVSGEEEPDWGASGANAAGTGASFQWTTSDGEVTWRVHGPEEDLWDVEQAASEAWKTKAGKCTDLVTTTRAGNQYNWSEIYIRCMEQSNSYGGKFIE